MNYSYILFDIDNTLIDFQASFARAATATLTYGGRKTVTPEDIALFYQKNDEVWFGMKLHHSDEDEVCRTYHPKYELYLLESQRVIKEVFGLDRTPEELDAVFRRELGAQAVASHNIFPVLEALKERYTLCVASNGLSKLQRGKLTAFLPYMTEVFISEDLQAVKPQKLYFDRIVSHLDCTPKDCLMVGDSLLNDIGGANAAGIDSCYYNPEGLADHQGIAPTYEIRDFLELLTILQ